MRRGATYVASGCSNSQLLESLAQQHMLCYRLWALQGTIGVRQIEAE
jgi:hypothetical protein